MFAPTYVLVSDVDYTPDSFTSKVSWNGMYYYVRGDDSFSNDVYNALLGLRRVDDTASTFGIAHAENANPDIALLDDIVNTMLFTKDLALDDIAYSAADCGGFEEYLFSNGFSYNTACSFSSPQIDIAIVEYTHDFAINGTVPNGLQTLFNGIMSDAQGGENYYFYAIYDPDGELQAVATNIMTAISEAQAAQAGVEGAAGGAQTAGPTDPTITTTTVTVLLVRITAGAKATNIQDALREKKIDLIEMLATSEATPEVSGNGSTENAGDTGETDNTPKPGA